MSSPIESKQDSRTREALFFRPKLCYSACLGSLLLLYPFLLVLNLLLKNSLQIAFLDTGFFLGLGMLSFFLRRFSLERFARKKKKRIGLVMLTILVSIGVVSLLCYNRPWYGMLGAAVILTFVLITTIRKANRAYYLIFSDQIYFNGSICFLVATLALWWLQAGNLSWTLIPCYLIYMVIYQVLHNRHNMESLMTRRGYSDGFLPAKIKKYNTILLVITGGCVLFFWTVLQKPFILGMDWVGQQAKKLVPFLIPKPHQGKEYVPGDYEPIAGDGAMEVLLSEKRGESVLMNVLLVAIFLVFLGFVLWIYRDSLSAIVKRKKVSRLLREETEDYINIEEAISKQDRGKDNTSIREEKRNWKKQYHQFLHMEDSMERFRLGYALVISGIGLKGIPVVQSDTTYEILVKAQVKLKSEVFPSVTDCYNRIRYGEIPLEINDFHSLGELLKQMK